MSQIQFLRSVVSNLQLLQSYTGIFQAVLCPAYDSHPEVFPYYTDSSFKAFQNTFRKVLQAIGERRLQQWLAREKGKLIKKQPS